MKQVRVVLTCDEGFVADSLRDFASAYEDNFGDFHEVEHGSGFLEFIEVPDPEPSLADIFDKKAKAVRDKREEERQKEQKKQKMLADERTYIRETAKALAFLGERGFKVSTYYGGMLDGWPYTYVRIEKSGLWVEIEGSSLRRSDGKLNQVSPYIANYVNPTMEELIETIAEW